MIAAPVTKGEVVRRDSDFAVVLMPTEQVMDAWGYIEGELDRDTTLWCVGQTKESIRDSLMRETLRWWMVGKGEEAYFNFMTHATQYPSMLRVLEVIWAQGKELDSFLGLVLSALESFAVKFGYDAVMVVGRSGWRVKLNPFGYQHHQTVLLKMLKGERMH